MLIGRLRVTRVWESQVLSGPVLALIVRIVPYSLVFTAAVGTAMAILIVFGQLRFAGNIFVFFPLLFLFRKSYSKLLDVFSDFFPHFTRVCAAFSKVGCIQLKPLEGQ